MSVEAELATASFRLMTREPFFGHVFSGLLRQVTTAVPSVGLGLAPGYMPRLRVNPDWWGEHAGQTDRQVGLLKHEVLHLVLEHVLREGDFRHRQVYWIAADLVVNQYIEDRYLGPDALTLGTFADLRLPPHEGVQTYYELLMRALQRAPAEGDGEGEGDMSGEPIASHPPSAASTGSGVDRLRQLIEQGGPALEQHVEWADFTAQRAAERRIVRQYIIDATRSSVRRSPRTTFDQLPASLRRHLAELLDTTPSVDWRRVLRLFAGSSRRSYLRNTLRRPSKRYGTTPGIKVRRRHQVVVAVDTSGSITDAMLALVFAEIHQLYRQGAEITVVECDAVVHDTWAYRGQPPNSTGGGGGTAFDPAIAWANALPRRPDALIYLTDGYAARPEVTPRMPSLWLIMPYGVTDEAAIWHRLPGRVVRIPDAALAATQ